MSTNDEIICLGNRKDIGLSSIWDSDFDEKCTEISILPVRYWNNPNVPWVENSSRLTLLQSWGSVHSLYIPCLWSSLLIQQGKFLKSYHLTLYYHFYLRTGFSFLQPLEAESQQVSQNCATKALVTWPDPSLHPCHIHPYTLIQAWSSWVGVRMQCGARR